MASSFVRMGSFLFGLIGAGTDSTGFNSQDSGDGFHFLRAKTWRNSELAQSPTLNARSSESSRKRRSWRAFSKRPWPTLTHRAPRQAADVSEQIVLFVYHKHGLPKPYQCNLNDLLTTTTFVQAVPKVICSKLHFLRSTATGPHGESVLGQTAVWLLQEAYELGRWMHLSYANGSTTDCPAFTPPSTANGTETEKKLKQEKLSILQRFAAQEAEMQRLLVELEATRSKAQVAEATVSELQAVQAQGQQVADTLAFNEGDDPPPLDRQPSRGGGVERRGQWRKHRAGRSGVRGSAPVYSSGKGKADYVLWGDNGKPLGVIEGKKTAVDPEVGRTQAKCYADGLEKMYGQRRPFSTPTATTSGSGTTQAANRPVSCLASTPRTAWNTFTTSGPTGRHSRRPP